MRNIDTPEDVPARSFIVKIPGHRSSYDMSVLVPLYGISVVEKLGSVLPKASALVRSKTFHNYFRSWRRFMLQGALSAEAGAPSSTVFQLIMDGRETEIEGEHVTQALLETYHRIADLNDFSFTSTTNDITRSNLWLSLRRFCNFLSLVHFLPPFTAPGAIATIGASKTPVLADLAREMGRLPPCSTWAEAEEQDARENIELMQLLRDELQKEFVSELDLFREGQRIITDHTLYSPAQIDEILANEGVQSTKLGAVGSQHRLHLAVKLFNAMMYEDFSCQCHEHRAALFLRSVGGQKTLSPYLGSTPKGLHAAFVIILIDTGWNLQPLGDLLTDPFVGKASRGKRKLKSVGSVKFRADSSLVIASLTDYPAVEADLQMRNKDGRFSGVAVIESWLEMTSLLREKAAREQNPAANWLWIWRTQFDGNASSHLLSVENDWWYAFLNRISSHPRLGGLPITHRAIRKTFANIAAAEGVFNIRLPMALADHASEGTTQQYLTETTIHAVYAAKMRKFMNLWESVASITVEGAARYLGLSDDDLKKQRQLGLASGLDFALTRQVEEVDGSATFDLAKKDRIFVVSTEAMEKLHLARLALNEKGSVVLACNPGRWVRSWLVWQVVVEGYCELIEKSRLRGKFRAAKERVEKRLSAEQDALPLVY